MGASPFQCMRAGFMCPKWDNFACLHTRKHQNELHLKIWFFFFFAKMGIFCKSICRNISQRCSNVYTTIFVWRKDKPNYLLNQTWLTIHEIALWRTLYIKNHWFRVTKTTYFDRYCYCFIYKDKHMFGVYYKFNKIFYNSNWNSNR